MHAVARAGVDQARFQRGFEPVEAVVERAQQLHVVERAAVKRLEQVRDQAFARREQPERIGHRRRLVQAAEELAESVAEPAAPVIRGRGGHDEEALHVDAAEEELQVRGRDFDQPGAAQPPEVRVDLGAGGERGDDAGQPPRLAAERAR